MAEEEGRRTKPRARKEAVAISYKALPKNPKPQNKGKVMYTGFRKPVEFVQNQTEVFLALKGAGALLGVRPMKVESVAYREKRKYCEYHQDSGHTTTECRILARTIE